MVERVPMTREGHESLLKELNRLKKVERPKVIEDIAEAREHGDLSENAEYDAAKEKQSFVEGRIMELEDKLSRAEVIDVSNFSEDRVVFGAMVTLQDENSGEEVMYKIVGTDEADPKSKKISVGSPIAKALIGKSTDDSVKVTIPSGNKEYVILDINYDQ